jgi:hypothetical protein
MRQRLGFALAFILVLLALASAPAQAGNCVLDVCSTPYFNCLQTCGHNPPCTEQCQINREYCYCHRCGITQYC